MSHAIRATQDGQVTMESSDKTCSAGEHVLCWNSKLPQHSCLENPMNSRKRQKDSRTLKDELPRSVGAQYTTGEEQRNSSRRNEEAEPKWKQRPVVAVSGGERKVQCCKEHHCIGTWNVRSMIKVNSVQFSCSVMSNSLQHHGLQQANLPCPSPTPRAYSNSCPLSQWCHPTISSLVVPFSSAFNLSQHQGLFKWVSSLHQVTKVLEFQLHHQSFQWIFRTDLLWDGLIGPPCCPRDSQESSPTPQFKSINSSALSFLYSPTVTSVHDYWKNHSFD